MSDKVVIKELFKIFGPDKGASLELARKGIPKDEIFRRTGGVTAVNDISFSIREGEIFVVMGLSGSGKSTLIRCINRLVEPTAGQVLLDGDDLTAADDEELRRARLYRLSMVFQHFALFPHMTLVENVEYGLKARGMARDERREKALAALTMVGLEAWADVLPSNCSGGMQQRVGLARGLAVDPEVLLMDEPFSALDPLIRRDMQDELLAIQDRLKTTVLFITHDLQEALKLGDQIAIMKNGRFVQVGTPEEIVTAPADDYVLEFTRDVDRSRILTFRRIMHDASPVPADAPLSEVRRRLEADDLWAVYVTNETGAPIGVIDRSRLNGSAEGTTARSVMSDRFTTVRASQPICDAFSRMGSHRPLGVVDSKGQLVGVVDPVTVFDHLGFDPGSDGGTPPERSASAVQGEA